MSTKRFDFLLGCHRHFDGSSSNAPWHSVEMSTEFRRRLYHISTKSVRHVYGMSTTCRRYSDDMSSKCRRLFDDSSTTCIRHFDNMSIRCRRHFADIEISTTNESTTCLLKSNWIPIGCQQNISTRHFPTRCRSISRRDVVRFPKRDVVRFPDANPLDWPTRIC